MKNTQLRFYAASLIICVGISISVHAAEATDNSADSLSRPPYLPWTVGAEAGSTGIGGFGSWRFYDHLGVRAGFDYFQWTWNDLSIGDFKYNAKVRLMSEPLTLDIYPWQQHSFHVSVGALFNQNQLTGSSSVISDLGLLDLKIQQRVVNPYASIGGNFCYFDHAHHWALGGELGAAYTGTPIISLNRSGVLSGGGQVFNNPALNNEDWADQFKWFPVVKLMVTYSF